MPSDLKKAKDKAWAAFSRFIRARDCIASTEDVESGQCITCKEMIPFKKAQAGHFIGGRSGGVLFDEEIVHLQCYRCNVALKGNYVEYTLEMIKRHGIEKVEELKLRKHLSIKYKVFDYERIRKEYDDKYEALLASV